MRRQTELEAKNRHRCTNSVSGHLEKLFKHLQRTEAAVSGVGQKFRMPRITQKEKLPQRPNSITEMEAEGQTWIIFQDNCS